MILSTSGGNLKNQQSINLIKLAKMLTKKVDVISLLEKSGGELKKISNECLIVDSQKHCPYPGNTKSNLSFNLCLSGY